MKRWVKTTIIATTCLVPVGFVAGFATDWSNKIPISCVGSSGVKPFVEAFGNEYGKTHKNVDITVDAGGSGFGISQIAESYCNIGDVSKNPFGAVRDDYKQQWIDNQIKTITIGWEAICMVWIPPKNIDGNLNELLTVDDGNNISDLMRIFSGFDDGHPINNDYGTLGEFCASSIINPNTKNKLNATKIIPYVRAGGALTSGTAASFLYESHLDILGLSTNDQQNALKFGKYGNDRKVYDTDEANSRAWEMFHKNNIPGSMIYLSSGFVVPNWKLIQSAGYGVMMYKNHPAIEINNKNQPSIGNDNKWLRPLNAIVSLKNIQKEEDFIDYCFANEDKLILTGGKPLTSEERDTMSGESKGWTDWKNWWDEKLMRDRHCDWDNDTTVFGARMQDE